MVIAGYKTVKISFENSSENQSVIEYNKNLLSSLQNFKSDSEFWDNRNMLDPNIGLGNPNTIYSNYRTVNQDFSVEETNNKIAISTIINSSNEKKIDSIIPLLKQKSLVLNTLKNYLK